MSELRPIYFNGNVVTIKNAAAIATVSKIERRYGRLYTYHEVVSPNGLAPIGWRVSSQQDWNDLRSYVVSEYNDIEQSNFVLFIKKQRTPSSTNNVHPFWSNNLLSIDNRFNLSILPSGRMETNFTFVGLNTHSWIWTSTNHNITYARAFSIIATGSGLSQHNRHKNERLGVRCLRDATPSELLLEDGTFVPDMIDIDGTNYHAVKIGTQVWITSNLVVTRYNNGVECGGIPYRNDNRYL